MLCAAPMQFLDPAENGM